MKHSTILRTATLGTLALVSALGGTGCSATPAYKPSQALLYRTPAPPTDPALTPRFQVVLAAGDRVGTQMREVYLARESGIPLGEAQPVLVLQSDR